MKGYIDYGKMDTNPTKYVVFDVETNGLKSKKDDLLSISFYKPDDGKELLQIFTLRIKSQNRYNPHKWNY